MLHDVDYLGQDPAKPKLGGKYEGRLDDAQLEFLRNVLAHTPEDTLVIAVMHIPIRTYLGSEPYQNLANKDALFRLLEGRKHTVSFSGHTHTTEHYREHVSRTDDAEIGVGVKIRIETEEYISRKLVDRHFARRRDGTASSDRCIVVDDPNIPSRRLRDRRETSQLAGKPKAEAPFVGKGAVGLPRGASDAGQRCGDNQSARASAASFPNSTPEIGLPH